MRITCPHCGFAKELAAEQVPANVIRVTCPSCRQPFPLTREQTAESAPTVEDVATETVGSSATMVDEPPATEPTSDAAIESTSSESLTDEPASSELSEPASSEPAESAEPASIGARYAALLIDTMLILIMVLILRTGLTLLGNGIQFEGQVLLGLAFMLFTLSLGFAYHTLFIGACGQTPGKRLMRIQVIATDRSAMTWSRAMLREVLGKTLSATLLLGYIMALFHPQRLAAHDKIADTCVVKFVPESPLD